MPWGTSRGLSVAWYQKLSEDFIEKHKDLVNWNLISECQQLSETFIEKYKDLVNWYNISEYQSLSDTFIEAHKNELNTPLVEEDWSR